MSPNAWLADTVTAVPLVSSDCLVYLAIGAGLIGLRHVVAFRFGSFGTFQLRLSRPHLDESDSHRIENSSSSCCKFPGANELRLLQVLTICTSCHTISPTLHASHSRIDVKSSEYSRAETREQDCASFPANDQIFSRSLLEAQIMGFYTAKCTSFRVFSGDVTLVFKSAPGGQAFPHEAEVRSYSWSDECTNTNHWHEVQLDANQAVFFATKHMFWPACCIEKKC